MSHGRRGVVVIVAAVPIAVVGVEIPASSSRIASASTFARVRGSGFSV